jgi:PAS domain S-box-containing protein
LWNAAAHRTFGYTEAEALGKELHPLLAPAHYLDAFRDGFRRFVADGAGPVVGKTVELDARRKDGSVFPMELSLSSVKVRGSWHAIGIARDISARKRHEAELMQANRALRTLSAGNAALVHALDEKALLHEMCEAVVTVGAYAAAAVVYALDADSLRVAVQAAVGGGWAVEGQRAHGGVGMDVDAVASAAIATQSPQCRELSIQASDSAAMAGVAVSPASRSVLALPLVSEKAAAFGALCIVAMDGEVFHEAEFKLLGELASDLAYGIETNRARGAQIAAEVELRESLQATVEAIGATVEARDPYTAGHQRRVAQLAAAIGQEMGLAPHTIEGIHFGAQIHDLGKIQIPGEILAKPARLSRIEFELIKQHPQVGYDILKGIKFPWPVADMVLQHHERLDGSGYPQGLKGEEIRLESRILAVADVVEAVGSHRPYRPALGVDAALGLIVAHRGTWFDGAVVDACVELFRTKAFAFQHS